MPVRLPRPAKGFDMGSWQVRFRPCTHTEAHRGPPACRNPWKIVAPRSPGRLRNFGMLPSNMSTVELADYQKAEE